MKVKRKAIKKGDMHPVFKYSRNEFDDLFNYATSIRESVQLFCDNQMTGAELIKVAYYKPTKLRLKRMFKLIGVNRTRLFLRPRVTRWLGNWRYNY